MKHTDDHRNGPIIETEPVDDINGKKAKKKKMKRGTKIMITLISILLVLGLIAVGIYAVMNWRPFDEEQPNNLLPTDQNLVETAPPQEIKNHQNFLICGVDNSENLTDIILVVSYLYEENTAKILQIPRDTIVDSKYNTGGTNKINGVYGNGATGSRKVDVLIDCLYDQLGIYIDHYALLTLEGFREMVDTLGGVEVNLQRNLVVEHPITNEHIYLEKGLNLLDGMSAEAFIRSRRHYAEGDIGRLKAQRQFYVSFASKVIGMSNIQCISAATKVYSDFTTDLSIGDIIKYANRVRSGLNINDVEIHLLPGEPVDYKGYSCWSIHLGEYVELYNQIFNPEGAAFSADSLNIPEVSNKYAFEDAGASFGEILGVEEPTSAASEE